ncbi:hypothetical protein SteCoe_6173 [Stentor coeruleus]|uniref:Uncharacterized protein n=1 Tax=Stentor coeruleus TaxID=5963 RepID=A0A1R2CQM0_9CILI|nr:hypothetical protein SteCoe_6173 [Stentor coeruleus]
MGGTGSITFQYIDQKTSISCKQLSFGNTIRAVKKTFKISKKEPLTLHKKNEGAYISTNYKWEEFMEITDSTIFVLNQIDKSVSNNQIINQISNSLFKIVTNEGKIVSLGVKISEKLGLCPRSLVINEEFMHFFNKHHIEFFNNKKGNFVPTGIFRTLGMHRAKENFFISEIEGPCETLNVKIYDKIERIKGYCIYFNKISQMLEAERVSHQKVPKDLYFTVKITKEFWLPGALLIGDNEETLAMYGGNHANWYSMFRIFSQLSELFEFNPELEFRTSLMEIPEMRIGLDNLTPVFNNILEIKFPSIKIENIFNQLI